MTLRDEVERALAAHVDAALAKALLDRHDELKQNYFLGKHGPAELEAGKFAEAGFRVLQSLTGGTICVTPIGTPLPKTPELLQNLAKLPSKDFDDSIRIHIPRVLQAVYDVRNRRGVGHLPGKINPNLADATLVMTACDWVLAELIRVVWTDDIEKAQSIVDALVQRRVPLVYDADGILRVLDTSLSYRNQALVLLYFKHPDWMEDAELQASLEYSNPSQFRNRDLRAMHKNRLIEFHGNGATARYKILPAGLREVEQLIRDKV